MAGRIIPNSPVGSTLGFNITRVAPGESSHLPMSREDVALTGDREGSYITWRCDSRSNHWLQHAVPAHHRQSYHVDSAPLAVHLWPVSVFLRWLQGSVERQQPGFIKGSISGHRLAGGDVRGQI